MASLDLHDAPRRRFLQRSAALGGLGLLGGCATAGQGTASAPPFRAVPPLAAPNLRADRITGITVCLRPFRAAGPRLDAETVGDKLVVHNYGHGGSGWSLGWGSALIAVKTALAGGARDVAVLGCGALGLTAATVAQQAGANVTIYAKERLPDARSARATGVWSPDSRIALAGSVDTGFPALWEDMARRSFRMHQQYLGLADAPVEWTERYMLSDGRPGEPDPLGFAHFGDRVRDLTPPSESLEPRQHPFPVPRVRRAAMPMFNIAAYGHLLMNDFLIAGGRFQLREFHSPSELSALPQKVVINCTGYGARALWKDESIVPVRGQIAWLIPQPEVTYSLIYKGVSTVSRRDGLGVQVVGPSDAYGYNDANEAPDRAESENGIGVLAPLFSSTSRR
jgi:D-amino-acid oxidase